MRELPSPPDEATPGAAAGTERRAGKGEKIWKPLAIFVVVALLVAAVLFFRAKSGRLAVHTRSVAEATSDAPAPPEGQKNVEIYFEAKEPVSARLVVLDEKGNKLAPARALTRDGDKMRIVVAPSTFAPHEGKAQCWVLAGTEPIVSAVADEAMALAAVTEGDIKAIARRQGAWIERVEL